MRNEAVATLDSGAISLPAPQREQTADAALIREPGSAGYWLLRVLTVMIFGASVFGFLISLITIYNISSASSQCGFGLYEVTLLLYLPLWPLAGIFLLLLTRSMARIDAGMVKLAWRSGMLKQPISGISGSSLPYIAPLALGGGYLPIFMVQCGAEQGEVIVGSIVGALLFYLGFALEDVRQFISRQDAMARICGAFADEAMMKKGIPFGADVPPACGGGRQECLPHHQEGLPHRRMSQYGPKNDTKQGSSAYVFSPTGLLLAGTLASFAAVLIVATFRHSYYTYYDERMIVGFCVIVLTGAAYSLYLLGRNWDQAVSRWREASVALMPAATNLFLLDAAFAHERRKSVFMKWFCIVPVIWAVIGLLWFVYFVVMKETITGFHFLMVFIFSTGETACALWLAYFLKQVSQWRAIQQRFWLVAQTLTAEESITDHRLDSAPLSAIFLAHNTALPRLYCLVVWGVVVLVGLKIKLYCFSLILNKLMRGSNFTGEEILGLFLLVIMFHYPTLWLAMLLREMLLTEAFYSKAVIEET